MAKMSGGDRIEWSDCKHKAETVHLRAHRAAEKLRPFKTSDDRILGYRYEGVAKAATELVDKMSLLLRWIDDAT